MKHHFVKTENYQSLLDGVAFMDGRGSLTTPLCLLHGEPGVGKTRNVSKLGPDLPAVFIKGHVGMNLDGLIWSVSQGLGIKHCANRTAEMAAQISALQHDGTKLIFDEAQFGLSMKSAGQAAAGIEYLRAIAEGGQTYAILICHESEVAGFSESKHIRSRIGHRIQMHDACLADTSAFVHALCDIPCDDDVGPVVHQQTGGKYRLIENALATLEQIARARGLPRLTAADIRKHRLVVDHEEGLVLKIARPSKPLPAGKDLK